MKKRKSSTIKRLARNIDFLRHLKKIKRKNYIKLMRTLPINKINLICECIYNALYSNLNLTKKKASTLKQRLLKNKGNYITLANKRTKPETRRKLLIQQGSGIGAILGTLIPIITSLVASR